MATYLKGANFTGSNGSHFYIQLYYDLSQDVLTNTSTITYYLYIGSTDNYSGYGTASNGYINGNWVGSFTSIGRNDYFLVGQRQESVVHNNDGTKTVSYSASVTSSWDYLGNASLSGDLVLPRIDRYPTLISAPNFNDEENPTITYTTIMGFSNATLSACISLTGARDDVPYRQIAVSSGSYTFELTNEERTTLRQACTGKTLQVFFFIRTTANNTNYYSTLTRTMSIINGEPTFTTTITEMNQSVIDILNDSSATTLIKNVSKALVRVTPTAYKEATISGVTINNTTITSSPYQTIIVPTSGTFTINVVDSRGYPTAGVETRNLIDYEKVKINNVSFERENPTSSNVILNLDCVYYSLSDDNLNNPITVQYKLDDGSFVTIPSTNYVIDNTNHKLTITDYEISNILPYTTQGEFTIKINDSLSQISDKITVIKGIPTMDLGEHDLQVNGDLYVADTDRENAQNILELIKSISGKVLWVNPDARSYNVTLGSFDSQSITLNSSDYDCYEVIYQLSMFNRRKLTTGKIITKGDGGTQLTWVTGKNAVYNSRTVTLDSKTQLTFDDCYQQDMTVSNGRCIPIMVIGYKVFWF